MPDLNIEKTDVFLVVFALVQVLGLFGFAGWEPDVDTLAVINAGVAFLAAVLRVAKSKLY